jgi:hypothetical protein
MVAHEVRNSGGSDRAQLANIAEQARAVFEAETLTLAGWDPRAP